MNVWKDLHNTKIIEINVFLASNIKENALNNVLKTLFKIANKKYVLKLILMLWVTLLY